MYSQPISHHDINLLSFIIDSVTLLLDTTNIQKLTRLFD